MAKIYALLHFENLCFLFTAKIRTGSFLPQNAHIDCSHWMHGRYLTLQRKDGLASMFLTEIVVQDEMTAATAFGIGMEK